LDEWQLPRLDADATAKGTMEKMIGTRQASSLRSAPLTDFNGHAQIAPNSQARLKKSALCTHNDARITTLATAAIEQH
jgi:hypothetical protein